MMSFRRMRYLLAAAVLAVTPAGIAQLQTDQVPQSRTVPVNESLRQEIDQSRWHFGTLRVHPLFSLRDFGYYGNVLGTSGGEVADWRATVGVGARFIQPLGPKAYVRAEALPEYTWYRKLADRRAFGGNYGASTLFLFNRMPIEIGASNSRRVSRVSSEDERAVLTTRTYAFARVDVEILPRLSLFGAAEADRPRYSITQSDRGLSGNIEQLEHNDTALRGGVRYRFRPRFSVGVAEETTKSHFVTGSNRDNRTHATMLLATYDFPTTFLNLAVSERKGEADKGGTFTPFSTTTGSYFVTHQLNSQTTFDVHGRRAVTYSTFGPNAYFVETRNGVGFSAPFGRRAIFRLIGEAGSNDYPAITTVGPNAIKRSDKAVTYGGGVAVHLYRRVVWATLGTATRYDSNIPGFDRRVVRVTTSLSVSGEFLQ